MREKPVKICSFDSNACSVFAAWVLSLAAKLSSNCHSNTVTIGLSPLFHFYFCFFLSRKDFFCFCLYFFFSLSLHIVEFCFFFHPPTLVFTIFILLIFLSMLNLKTKRNTLYFTLFLNLIYIFNKKSLWSLHR